MNIIQKNSPNFTNGRGGKGIQEFIIHWMAGTLASTDATFQNRARNTSAHYGIEDDKVHQYVDLNNTAYHAGNWNVNQSSIGIEHSAAPGRNASDATYETSAQLIASIIKAGRVGRSYRKHSAVVATACPGTIDVDRIARRVNEILGQGGAPIVLPAPAPAPTPTMGTAVVTVDALNVRTKPTSSSPIGGSRILYKTNSFRYVEAVQGENVRGVSTWLKSEFGNYVWAGGTNYATTPAVASAKGGTVKVTGNCNVRTEPKRNAPLGGSRTLNSGDTFKWVAKVYGDYVGNNNVWYQSSKGNFVWSGNLKEI